MWLQALPSNTQADRTKHLVTVLKQLERIASVCWSVLDESCFESSVRTGVTRNCTCASSVCRQLQGHVYCTRSLAMACTVTHNLLCFFFVFCFSTLWLGSCSYP